MKYMNFKKDLADQVVKLIKDNTPEAELCEVGALIGASLLGVYTNNRDIAHALVEFTFNVIEADSPKDNSTNTTH